MLVELTVVILIIGILAAIAVPSFIGQTGKAVDAQAKSLARTAQTTAEAIGTSNEGAYEKVSTGELKSVEPVIRIAASNSDAYVSSASGGKTEYTITAKSTNGDEFSVNRNALGVITRTCLSPRSKTGCSGGEKGSW
jgi:type IV pilus assembly protein PilA